MRTIKGNGTDSKLISITEYDLYTILVDTFADWFRDNPDRIEQLKEKKDGECFWACFGLPANNIIKQCSEKPIPERFSDLLNIKD